MSKITQLRPVEVIFDESIDRPVTLIPEGIYELRYLYYETWQWRDQPKIIATFEVLCGPHIGEPLYKYYNVKAVEGIDVRNGKFKPPNGPRSNLVSDFRRLSGDRVARRVTLDFLRDVTIEAEIRTVNRNSKRKLVPEDQHYSKVHRLIRLKKPGSDLDGLAEFREAYIGNLNSHPHA